MRERRGSSGGAGSPQRRQSRSRRRSSGTAPESKKRSQGHPLPRQAGTPDRSYLNLHQLRPWLPVRRGGEAMILSYITIITLESLTHIKSIYKDLLAVLSISK